jgi:Do/DeqQ family serine protease
MFRRSASILAAVTLVACALAPAMLAMAAGPQDTPVSSAGAALVVPETQAEITLSFAPVVRKAAPAVVNIFTRKVVERRLNPFAGDPFFDRFFRDMFPGPRVRRGVESSLGSGVILGPSGVVVSNYHVVGGADEITVVLPDRREFQGEVVFADEATDLAVVQLEDASGLPTVAFRDSNTLEVGDLVLAIGNPFGVGQTVTSGIVSGLARSTGAGRAGLFIQTDAAINPGNSGGALVDMQGRLVGINTAILSRSGGNIGIGFAVPANLVERVVSSALRGESALVRPWLGFEGQPVDAELAAALGLAAPQGVLVEALHPDSPLALAGLERGDVITELDGRPVNTVGEIEFGAATRRLGETLGLGYVRRGAPLSASVRLAAAAERPPRDLRTLGPEDGLPGLTVMNVNPAVIDEVGLPVTSRGVLVVGARGAAERLGLRSRDFVRKVGDGSVADVAALAELLRAARGLVVLEVERDGRLGQLSFRR